jgi:hypothetical protein
MNGDLFEKTKLAAYFLWEHTSCESALDLWYCAEDIACYFEQTGILSPSRVTSIKQLGVYDMAYIHFVRHVAFRIFVYTNHDDAEENWFAAERLLSISEWVNALVGMADTLHNQETEGVRNESVKAFYD